MKLLVSAGPTREFLDPVRFLSNRSTGRMGYAVAEAGVAAGDEVALVSGPVEIAPPAGLAALDRVVSARDMLAALEKRVEWCDALVMTAAVADFRPESAAADKIRKGEMPETIRLVRNPDILKTLAPRKGRRVFVGFAAETRDAAASAARKLAAKGLDLVVANDVTAPGAGFGVDTNVVTLVSPDAPPESFPIATKRDIAAMLVERVRKLLLRQTESSLA
ncbi:MAG: phosphopantothenoylcysteine decarboxylase [Kiritimatiellae bacterium]|nr:phosphopantothenoylcysteine decarboxylase [Kiritimatiellia bacterium]